jgi:Fusaric acid resistance protein-like
LHRPAESADISAHIPSNLSLGALAGNFALWASVSEGHSTRYTSSRDLTVLCIAAALGAASYALCAPVLRPFGHAWPETILVVGAFLAGFLKRYGITGAGIGSQIYIGQLMACSAKLVPMDMKVIGIAMCIAIVSAVVPRLLSGPAERPTLQSPLASVVAVPYRTLTAELVMGLQAAAAALVIVMLNGVFGLIESEWAITACVYVIAGTSSGTMKRVRHRIVVTLIGVPLGLACLPFASDAPLLLWAAASLAMIVYAMALPERYDVACGAFAFVLMVTLAVSGEHSMPVLFARLWETLLGGALGLAAASLLFPLRAVQEKDNVPL